MRLLVSLALNNVETNRVRVRRTLPKIETTCSLEAFRRFMITSTCRSFIPNDYQLDAQVFPERSRDLGTMYVEAEDKVTLGRVNDISFVKVNYVLGIIYNSKSGRAVATLESFLLARLESFRTIYFHRASRAVQIMIVQALEAAKDELNLLSFDEPEDYLRLDDYKVWTQ